MSKIAKGIAVKSALLTVCFGFAGCVSVSNDGGMGVVQSSVSTSLSAKVDKDETGIGHRAAIHALLKKSLSPERAVQVVLFNNKGLQAAFNDLGVSEAQFVQASQPTNPSLTVLGLTGGGAFDIEQRLTTSLLALFLAQPRQELAQAQIKAAQIKAIATALQLAADTRAQYWRTVAAREQYATLVLTRGSAQTAAELAQRLGQTGALGKLDQAREFAFHAELSARVQLAQTQVFLEHERLARLMGLWGKQATFTVPMRLPALPKKIRTERVIETDAILHRVDLKLARATLDVVARQYGLVQSTRLISVFDFTGAQNNAGSSGARTQLNGAEINLSIPIYDFGSARIREAEQAYRAAANRLADKAITIRSQVREAFLGYRGAWSVARTYQLQVLPLRKTIEEEQLLQYNGMLADMFTLLVEARARLASQSAAIDAKRDFWLAQENLRAATIGGFNAASATDGKAPANDSTQ
ncbi:MAG: TolC family protein [Hyphomicrobiales bacterium]|nr:TolC family protein [Hyphomicrobiales bacterium]